MTTRGTRSTVHSIAKMPRLWGVTYVRETHVHTDDTGCCALTKRSRRFSPNCKGFVYSLTISLSELSD